MLPAVSVIVPNYNHGAFLRLRLESILQQTFTDFELILLDDASTDTSKDVFGEYSDDPRVKTFFNDINSGSPFRQWNLGMSLAKGKYIWLAESDDFSAPNFLETLVGILEANGQCGVAFCQSNCVDLHDRVIGKFTYGQFPNSSRWNGDFTAHGKEEVRKYFSIANTIPNASAAVFRADLARDISPASDSLKLAGDWLFWVQLLNKTDLAYVSQPLNYFRQTHEQSQRSRSAKDGLEILEGLDIYEYIEREVGLSRVERRRALGVRIRQWMFLNWTHHFDKELNLRIFRRLEYLGCGVYGESAAIVRLKILSRICLHAATQQPLIRRILKPIWLFFNR